jgi:hypothetical protein
MILAVPALANAAAPGSQGGSPVRLVRRPYSSGCRPRPWLAMGAMAGPVAAARGEEDDEGAAAAAAASVLELERLARELLVVSSSGAEASRALHPLVRQALRLLVRDDEGIPADHRQGSGAAAEDRIRRACFLI